MNYKIRELIRELANNAIAQPKITLLKVVIHSWSIHSSIDGLASCMAPGF